MIDNKKINQFIAASVASPVFHLTLEIILEIGTSSLSSSSLNLVRNFINQSILEEKILDKQWITKLSVCGYTNTCSIKYVFKYRFRFVVWVLELEKFYFFWDYENLLFILDVFDLNLNLFDYFKYHYPYLNC